MSSIQKIRKICQPNAPTLAEFRKNKRMIILDWYGWLIRKISIYITLILVKTPLSPNQVTFIGILLGTFGATLLASTNFSYLVAGISMLILSVIIDYVDGEVARYKRTTSKFGKFLDATAYDVPGAIMFFSLSIMTYNTQYKLLGIDLFHNISILILGFSASISFLLIHLSSTLFKLIFEKSLDDISHDSVSEAKSILWVLYVLAMDRDTIVIFMPILLLLDLLYVIPVFYGILYPLLYIAYLIYKSRKA